MCGTPLPHRPLTALGAQGTLSLTRVPLTNAKPTERQPAATPAQEASPSTPPSRAGVPIKMPSAESRAAEAPQSEDTVSRPTSTDSPVTAASATGPKGTAIGTSPVPPTEDLREQLGLEDAPGEERPDRPRFLDFSQPPPPPEEPAPRASNVVGPSFLGLSDAPRLAAEPAGKTEIGKPSRGSWLTGFAVAALLVFAVLGVLEWRSQVNQTNDGPVEVIKMKIQNMRRGDSQAPQSAGSVDTNAPKPEIPVEAQPKPQDQNAAANSNAPSSTSANSPSATPDANAGTTAGNSPQNVTAATGNQTPAGQNTAPPAQSSSVNGAQPAAGQNATQRKATLPASTSNAAPAPVAPDVAQPAAQKPKPKPQAAPEDNEEATVKKVIPGGEELDKASMASDSAAAAAWLWKATAKGNPDAPVRLADMYIKGNGVPHNCEQALVLLKTAATRENVRARNRLASMYSSGTCVQRSRVEAYRWLSSALAADPNSRSAQQNRDLLWRQMTPEERAEAEDR